MIRGLYTAISGMITGEAKQGVITNNLANANTNGFKCDNLAVKNFGDVMLYNYDKVVGNKNYKNNIGEISKGSAIDTVDTHFTQGILQQTKRDKDFAIEGRGFFTVNRNGKEYYTRDGHFNVNLDGYLTSDNGDLVQGFDLYTGRRGPVKVDAGDIACTPNGNIRVNGVEKYKLDVKDFQNYNTLKKVGDNLYEGNGAREAVNYNVRNRTIEKSNVNIIKETIDMMNNSKAFESNQKVVQTIDETLGKAVNEIGRC